jgi:hypothetical protein
MAIVRHLPTFPGIVANEEVTRMIAAYPIGDARKLIQGT